MKFTKILSASVATLMALGCLTACGDNSTPDSSTADSSASTEDTIKIAVAGPMTGDNAEYGIGFTNAANLMAAKWNDEKGGVLGKKIEIVQYDDKNSSEEAATIAQKIVGEKDIAGVIGHFASGVCLTAAPIYQQNQIIEISPSASHPDYAGVGDYIFRNNTVISAEAAASINIATEKLGHKKIGVISIMTDWGTNTAGIINDLVADMGGDIEIVAHEEVVEGSDDYSPAITKLNQAGAEVVICAGMYNLVAPVAKQYKQVNPDIDVIGFSNAYSNQLIELGGDAVEGVCFPVIFFSESDDEAVKSYVEEYTTKYGAAPSALTSQAYDSVGMLLTAIEEAGTTDSATVRDTLNSITYPGVTGETKFDENGEVQKQFLNVTIEDGKFKLMD